MRKTFSIVALLILILTSCSTAAPTPIPTDVPTRTTTATETHPPTETPQPTNTPKPTTTPTKVGISNEGPTESQIDNIFNEADVEFPKSLTFAYHDEYYNFELRLSSGVVKNAGIANFNPPDELKESFAYEVLGRIMYVLKNDDKNRYGEFDRIEQMMNEDLKGPNQPLGFPRGGSTIYQDLARDAIKKGPVVLNRPFSPHQFIGKISSIEMSLMTRNELDRLSRSLDKNDIKYAWRPGESQPLTLRAGDTWDSDTFVLLTNEGKMIIATYNRGGSNPERFSQYDPPTVFQHPKNDKFFYLSSVAGDLQSAIYSVQLLLAKPGETWMIQPVLNDLCPITDDYITFNGENGSCQALANSSFAPY